MHKQHDANKQQHPDVLSTLEEYQNAPDGTVVIHRSYLPSRFQKRNGRWYWDKRDSADNVSMALRGSVDVLCWGEEK